MLDDAMGAASMVTLEPCALCATVDLRVGHLAPARPGRLVARARVAARRGSRAFLSAELHAADEALLATATATARIIRPKAAEA